MLKLQNTLTGTLDAFEPLHPPRVTVYGCGPTVYNLPHIGNYRTFTLNDILNRYLRWLGYEVEFIVNLTDIDDKTIRDSKAAGESLEVFTGRYTRAFFEDLDTLRIRRADLHPKATAHIPEMIRLVEQLLANGMAYESDGSVYFKVGAFPGYGKLSKKDLGQLRQGARVESDEYEKEDLRDFVLWKGWKEGEPRWETPFGPGRPGWHLECSAMSMKYLGETFDIHTGGADLVFPHHENEIAQSEGATGRPFCRNWLHVEFLVVNGEKMSKSKGNFYTLRDLLEKGHHPLAIRYLLLSVHYRKQLNFTMEGLQYAQASVDRIQDFVETLKWKNFPGGRTPGVDEECQAMLAGFQAGLDDDLNTASALAALFEFIREINRRMAAQQFRAGDRDQVLAAMLRINEVLDVLPADTAAGASPEVAQLLKQREEARQAKDWPAADALRNKLTELGIVIKDTPRGTIWKKA